MQKRTTGVTIFVLLSAVLGGCKNDRVEYGGRQGGAVIHDPPDVHLEGDHLRIDSRIHFAFDSDEILDDSTEILDHVAEFLGNHPEITGLHLIGHTDSVGDDAHNLDLSTRRAAAVERALRERGVTQILDSRGAGETAPLCHEDTEECHAQNRRVEFAVDLQ